METLCTSDCFYTNKLVLMLKSTYQGFQRKPEGSPVLANILKFIKPGTSKTQSKIKQQFK